MWILEEYLSYITLSLRTPSGFPSDYARNTPNDAEEVGYNTRLAKVTNETGADRHER
jgi:hypothetical protein